MQMNHHIQRNPTESTMKIQFPEQQAVEPDSDILSSTVDRIEDKSMIDLSQKSMKELETDVPPIGKRSGYISSLSIGD